jgi:hypothetical protein
MVWPDQLEDEVPAAQTVLGLAQILRGIQANVDLGATPIKSGKFTLTDPSIGAGSKVFITTAGVAYTSKGVLTDEIDLQGPINWNPVPGAGTATIYWDSPYFQYGNIKYNYMVI